MSHGDFPVNCCAVFELATRGTLFRHAYSTSAWTFPAVASLFTSRYPQQHRVVQLESTGERLDFGRHALGIVRGAAQLLIEPSGARVSDVLTLKGSRDRPE